MTNRTIRWASVPAIAAACALVFTGCSGSSGDDATGDSTSSAPAGQTTDSATSDAPTTGGTLVVGITSDPDTLFPWKATQFQAVRVLENLYDTITELDADLNVVPGLAESWDVSDDGLTVTFHLRDDVTFADGSALDSADVVDTVTRIQDEATAAVAATTLASVTKAEAVDPTTVAFTLSAPDAGLLAGLASVNVAVISSDDDESTLTTTANGSGPFQLEKRTPNESILVKANATYWGGAPKLDAVEYRIIPDETSIVSAMQSGDVQFAAFDDPLVAQTAKSGNVTVTGTPQLAYHALQLNARKAPLDDVNVRLAIQCAIDRQEVLDTAAQGEGSVVGPITSPAYFSDPEDRPCPQRDVDKAKEYLADAGYADGLSIPLLTSQNEYATSVNEAQNVQAQLAEAGITADLEVLDIGAYVDRWKAADFSMAIALNGGRPDPDGMYGRYFTSTGSLNAVAGYSSDTLDQLFAEGKQTSDVAKRKEIYKKISEELEDNAAWIWMFSSYTYTATANNVQGYEPMPTASQKYLRVTSLT